MNNRINPIHGEYIMANSRKSVNVEIGKRLQEARKRLGYKQSDFAQALGVTDEHYRKYELGASGIPIDKVQILFEKFCLDPTYLITGKISADFDLETYLASCSAEKRIEFMNRVWKYMNQVLDTIE